MRYDELVVDQGVVNNLEPFFEDLKIIIQSKFRILLKFN